MPAVFMATMVPAGKYNRAIVAPPAGTIRSGMVATTGCRRFASLTHASRYWSGRSAAIGASLHPDSVVAETDSSSARRVARTRGFSSKQHMVTAVVYVVVSEPADIVLTVRPMVVDIVKSSGSSLTELIYRPGRSCTYVSEASFTSSPFERIDCNSCQAG